MGETFEEIYKQYLWKENIASRLPFRFNDCGRWWGNNPILQSEQEIDLLAINDKESKAIFCECKWTEEQIDTYVLNSLVDKSTIFKYKDKYYILFSRSGFKDNVRKRINDRILLVDFSHMNSQQIKA